MENIVNSTIALYKAYRKTRCGKRDNPTAMRYRMEAIERTVALSERLQRRDYSFGPYYPFKVYEPSPSSRRAWIEIASGCSSTGSRSGRPPRGGRG